MRTADLRNQLLSLPLSPGIYIFKNNAGAVLYVGKATKLRSRVRSYFAKSSDLSPAKQLMVKRIAGMETIITSNETEALILESTLIKKHKPPYNVTLKDDKNYNFIKIDYRTSRPLVTTVRRPEHDAGRSRARYFGPYTYGAGLYENLRLLRRIFPFKTKSSPSSPFERELERKRSLGPVPETDAEYAAMIERFIRVLEGRGDEVMADLRSYMERLAREKQYEKAARVRDQLRGLSLMQSRQNMVSVRGGNEDVVSIHREGDAAAVNVFVIRAGKLIDKLNFLLQHVADEREPELLDAFLAQYYSDTTNPPRELILPAHPSLSGREISALARSDVSITVPARGKKRQLIKLGEENAKEYLAQSRASWERATHEALEELQKALKLKTIPNRIEGFDISNIQGNYSVGSMVVFVDGAPDKNEYRKFKIKTVKGADDFASLAEVLKRRFSKEGWPKPDLILLDGGKGQLSAVINVLSRDDETSPSPSLVRRGTIVSPPYQGGVRGGLAANQFIALAKREEEVFQGRQLKKINLNPASAASRLLQRIRDEAHRFGQAYYHSRHAKAGVQSALDSIPGIGPTTKKLLLRKFGSVSGIKKANRTEIEQSIGKTKTETLMENL
ncbi:MAG: excinuclease ABC subunit UvrC [Parcubacteria group bacterium]|nr:excinuclease ABC subunit UvrC [Parcubacteria group bacterium]